MLSRRDERIFAKSELPHRAVRLNAMLYTIELPARISDLDAPLADVERL